MSVTSPIDVLASPAALDQFAERRASIQDAVRELGLVPGSAVVIGGGGFAAQDLDTYTGLSKFDGDAAVSDDLYRQLGIRWMDSHWLRTPPQHQFDLKTGSGLRFTVLSSPFSDAVSEGFGTAEFNDLAQHTVVYDGVPTLSAPALAHSKLTRDREKDPKGKDPMGIVKAHVVAWLTGHDVLHNPDWYPYVAGAVEWSRALPYEQGWSSRKKSIPAWMGSLITSDFDHPAFRRANVPGQRAA